MSDVRTEIDAGTSTVQASIETGASTVHAEVEGGVATILTRIEDGASKVWFKSKTILLSLALAGVGLADSLGAINLTPLFHLFGVPEDKQAGVTLLLSIVFAMLRLASTGAVTATKKDDAA